MVPLTVLVDIRESDTVSFTLWGLWVSDLGLCTLGIVYDRVGGMDEETRYSLMTKMDLVEECLVKDRALKLLGGILEAVLGHPDEAMKLAVVEESVRATARAAGLDPDAVFHAMAIKRG